MSSRVLAGAIVLALLAVAGCNTTVAGSGTLSGVPPGGPSTATVTSGSGEPAPTSGSGEPAPTTDPDETSPPPAAVFELGETGTVTDQSGNPLADITVSAAVETAQPPDEFSDPPENGTFLSATVTIANLGEDVFTAAPFDFLVRYPDGTQATYGEGSSGVFGYDNLLELVDLNAGETATGVVVFDVDPAVNGRQIVYSDLSGRVLGAWNVP
ncbi:MAG: DUF4352 domain-containing protein [Geodermatophilaceae bacterium]|nr:DUF4352 domain-containing protein [Geodermatophilaceae bacterium]